MLRCLALAAAPARADEPGVASSMDEPHLIRLQLLRPASGFWSRRPRGPSMEFMYRTYSVADMGGRSDRYHVFGVRRYVISRLLRLGGGLEAGFDAAERDNFLIGSSFNVGLQYPTGVTPFIDFVFGLGVLRRDFFNQDLYSFTYDLGLEAGVHFFVHPRFCLSTSIGWRRPAVRQGGDEQVETVYVYSDSFCARVGFGF